MFRKFFEKKTKPALTTLPPETLNAETLNAETLEKNLISSEIMPQGIISSAILSPKSATLSETNCHPSDVSVSAKPASPVAHLLNLAQENTRLWLEATTTLHQYQTQYQQQQWYLMSHFMSPFRQPPPK